MKPATSNLGSGPALLFGIVLSVCLVFGGSVFANTLCFVNALPRAEKVNLLYQGKKIRPIPFGEGDITACLKVPPGNLAFTVEDPLQGSLPMVAKVDAGQHKTLVVYEKIILDPKSAKETKKVSVLEIPQVGSSEGGKTRFRIAYVGGKEQLELRVNDSPLKLAPDGFTEPLTGGLSVKVADGAAGTEPRVFSFEGAQSFVLVIFYGYDGKLKMSVAYETL